MTKNTSKYEYGKSTKDGQWYWRFKAANHEPVASGEGYNNKQDCLHAIELLKASKDAEVIEKNPTKLQQISEAVALKNKKR